MKKYQHSPKIPFSYGIYLIVINNYITIIIPNDSLNPEHLIVVAQENPQPNDQI